MKIPLNSFTINEYNKYENSIKIELDQYITMVTKKFKE